MSDTALVLIDIQNDYFPGGKMSLEGPEEAARQASRALDHFRRHSLPVYHIRHESVLPGSTFMIPGTPGAEIHPLVKPRDDEPVITKHFPNAFRQTGLLEALQKRRIGHLVFAGMMTHMCIDTSVRAGFDLGFRATLLHDATATRALPLGDGMVPAGEVQGAFIAALGQIFATVVDTAAFLG
jgi:nicotinamidase-related amidase